ncbi:ABC transporter substrate-binding protein [Roseomonas sp. M0104]|uniref:ABC transporter substrate-binding protein n=2 Tax=Teichococcus coralli TaxID=2545983 RepID=A0A845BBG5_9PROT|nr:ABC transporter substrate-binding protein [Pseudoroseomonas coralli]
MKSQRRARGFPDMPGGLVQRHRFGQRRRFGMARPFRRQAMEPGEKEFSPGPPLLSFLSVWCAGGAGIRPGCDNPGDCWRADHRLRHRLGRDRKLTEKRRGSGRVPSPGLSSLPWHGSCLASGLTAPQRRAARGGQVRMTQTFQQDCVELLQQQHQRGRISRRAMLWGLAALGAAPALRRPAAAAQGKQELVLVNWGGIAMKGFDEAYGKPFMAENPGWTVVQDSSGPSAGRIRSMVESGHVTWDLCDSSAASATLLSGMNLLTPVDYGVVRKENVIGPAFAVEYGAAPYSFSNVLAYDSSKFPTPPTGWKDFFDLKRFPGTRLIRRDARTSLDIATVSLGADPKAMYPLDVGKALKRIGDIKGNAVYWNNGSESEQYLRTGEAVMGCIWHTRASVLERETQGRIKFIWDQGMLQAGIMVIPKNNPGGAAAQRLLASMLAHPEPQVALLKLMGNGPTNPRAAEMVPPELRRLNPTDPANVAKQFYLDETWWGKNYQDANAEYLDFITG